MRKIVFAALFCIFLCGAAFSQSRPRSQAAPLATAGQTKQHSITVGWTASTTSPLSGYNVYRGSVSGGPYSLLNSIPISSVSYVDLTCPGGTVCYYVVTAVDMNGFESVNSNEASALMPVNPNPPTAVTAKGQ